MDETSSPELITKDRHQIPVLSVEDFRNPNIIPDPIYKFGEQVTRKKIAAFLIDQFAKSEGDPLAQNAYLEYLQVHSIFDYKRSYKNILEANGMLDLASTAEKNMIREAYIRVKYHFGDDNEFWGEEDASVDEVMIALDGQLKEQAFGVRWGDPLFSDNELATLDTKTFLKELKNRRSKSIQ